MSNLQKPKNANKVEIVTRDDGRKVEESRSWPKINERLFTIDVTSPHLDWDDLTAEAQEFLMEFYGSHERAMKDINFGMRNQHQSRAGSRLRQQLVAPSAKSMFNALVDYCSERLTTIDPADPELANILQLNVAVRAVEGDAKALLPLWQKYIRDEAIAESTD